jgi:preprotein translocase subunit YajC
MFEKLFKALHIILLLSIVVIILFSCKDSAEKDSKPKIKTDNSVLVGDWVRTDASYLVKIIKVNEDRTLDAQYFNPNPINIGKANWEESYGNLKIIIELRNVNYPGSTYTLNYLPDKDLLAGNYYQAVEGLTFYVEFTRNR